MFEGFFSYRVFKRARRALRFGSKLYSQKKSLLCSEKRTHIEQLLTALQGAILEKNQAAACEYALVLQEHARTYMPKNRLERARDFCFSLFFALAVALVVRQVWFEPYTIPTGSMRPTLKEEDLLLVSKTDFGINTLTPTGHYTFDPSLLQRGSIVVFSGAGMDLPDNNTRYFWIIPGKKQYVKRLIGKPGDTLYFYGGRIYGLDANGNPIPDLHGKAFDHLEHIPFLRFEGREKQSGSTSTFYHVNQPVAKLKTYASGMISGVMENSSVQDYSDLFGFKNFAMVRLLTSEQMRRLYPLEIVEPARFYLELTHHPSLRGALPGYDHYPSLARSVSFLPLDDFHTQRLFRALTTCRFVVKNERAYRFGSSSKTAETLPHLKGVPDGMYEFQNGKATRVLWTAYPPLLSILWNGISYELSPDHPLLREEHLYTLYNLGIEFNMLYAPLSPVSEKVRPPRYAYFRDGALYCMGSPLFEQGDSALENFIRKERKKTHPFVDAGEPSSETIRKFGLKVPEDHVFVLGDNHAMSADSRVFGFVPFENLRGGASLLYWPPSPRWGRLPQPSTPHLTLPNCTIWGAFFLSLSVSSLHARRRARKPLKF